MTSGWRSVFLYPFFLLLVSAPVAVVIGLLLGGSTFHWVGLAVAAAPMIWFFKRMAGKRTARFPAALPLRGASAYPPTVVVTGPTGLVVLNAQTDNYRVRPEPATNEPSAAEGARSG